MIFMLNGFCTGLSVIFASLYGADDKKKFREEVFVAFSLGGVLAILIGAVFFLGAGAGLRMIGTPEKLIGYGSAYLRVIAGGLIITYAYNLFSAILQAVGDTRASLGFLIVATK
ncbi:MATE family efflux transporter [Brotaphodocola sp.]|uniref:MATE family efflux transporter n=1 Tax=Brotaphodocola sp. TaxID=3073577 RepID=UPI003D7EA9F0